jgi:ribosomal protein S18 acetylase RimI-like enzyme
MEIRAATQVDWEILRDLRRAALQDSPDSFGPTFEMARTLVEEDWRSWAAGRAGMSQAFIAFEGARPVGLVSGGRNPGQGTAHWGALWVAPSARKVGLGKQLAETVCAWLEAAGATHIELEVTDGNPAERLYESLGFVRTGASKPLRDGSELREVTMARDVKRENA